VTIDSASFTDNHDVTWVGATGERDTPWALGIPPGNDPTFLATSARLIESYFMWTSDTARVDIEPGPGITLAEGIRAGHFAAPTGAGTLYRADQVVEETIQELDTLPPAWRIVVRYRPNYAPQGQVPAAVSPGERAALLGTASELEVFRDETIRVDFDNAREVFWDVMFWDIEVAARIGQLLADFLKVPRTWWSFKMEIRPEDVLVGEQISVPHDRFDASGAVDMVVQGKRGGITPRGVDLVTVS
jgi:hypothetical protein